MSSHSIYTHCWNCHMWGINLPGNTLCGNCGSAETTTYYPDPITTLLNSECMKDEEVGYELVKKCPNCGYIGYKTEKKCPNGCSHTLFVTNLKVGIEAEERNALRQQIREEIERIRRV